MTIDYDRIAGTPCAGCGVGDAIEILELDGPGRYINGRVYHVGCQDLSLAGPITTRCPRCYSQPGEPCYDLRANGPNSGPEPLVQFHRARHERLKKEIR